MIGRRITSVVWLAAAILLVTDDGVGRKARGQDARKSDPQSTAGAIHLGKLGPVDEPAAIAATARGLQSVPGHDVRFGYFIGAPEGWYEVRQGTLSWREPSASETHHVGITLQDAADLRAIPDCKVFVSAADCDGREIVSTAPLSLMWGTQFYYYGANLSFPQGATSCTLSVRSESPGFARRTKDLGGFFTRPVSFCWQGVELPRPGRESGEQGRVPMTGDFGEGRHPAMIPTPYPGSVR